MVIYSVNFDSAANSDVVDFLSLGFVVIYLYGLFLETCYLRPHSWYFTFYKYDFTGYIYSLPVMRLHCLVPFGRLTQIN